MNYAIVRNLIGKIMFILGILMLLPLIFCIAYQESFINYLAFLIPAFVLFILGFLFNIKKAEDKKMLVREGFIIVGVAWLIMSLFGCLPFIISGVLPNFFDAFFEISSGFSTTGATVMSNVEASLVNNHSVFFWRSFAHWVGGMGVLVFVLAIIPESDEGSSIHILKAESPGPQVGRLVTKMKASSRILYLIYMVLTVLQVFILWLGPDKNMNLFASIIYSLGSAGTGGLAIDSASVGAYGAYSQYVIAIFMLIFSINFTIYYYILIKNFKDIFNNEELKWYLVIVALSIVFVFISIYPKYETVEEVFRHSFFQVVSVVSTTGFATVDYALWPALALVVIFILMFMGACAGSTAGGIKCSRVVILVKSAINKIKLMINPRKVEVIKMDGKVLPNETVDSVQSFIIVYFLVFFLCSLIVAADPSIGDDFSASITASLTCISNVGAGFSSLGPAKNFANLNWFTKFVLSLEMIAGRLELFPLLILFNPKTWRAKRM